MEYTIKSPHLKYNFHCAKMNYLYSHYRHSVRIFNL
uniref:Uncharacterized protein n=1 Tax=Anguilla anguilla TaxID=7936 RepID=A0A0E9QCZ9_ANGAN